MTQSKSGGKSGAGKASGKKLSARLRRALDSLEESRNRLRQSLGMIESDRVGDDASSVGDIADAATHQTTRTLMLGLRQTEHDELTKIEAAIAKIHDGTYGQCVRCGKPIETARLDAIPYAPSCIACKRKEESGRL